MLLNLSQQRPAGSNAMVSCACLPGMHAYRESRSRRAAEEEKVGLASAAPASSPQRAIPEVQKTGNSRSAGDAADAAQGQSGQPPVTDIVDIDLQPPTPAPESTLPAGFSVARQGSLAERQQRAIAQNIAKVRARS